MDMPAIHSVWVSTEDGGTNNIRTAIVKEIHDGNVPRVTFTRIRVLSKESFETLSKGAYAHLFPRVSYVDFTWTLEDFIDGFAPMIEEQD